MDMERSQENQHGHGQSKSNARLSRTRSKALSKVHYRPLEAAIRWSGLLKHESQILADVQGKTIPDPDDFPKWPELRLNIERIFDGIINKELPCGINGVTIQDHVAIEHPDLTIRHVDLKSWMTRYYPGQKPDFLFSRIERESHPTVTLDDVQVLILQRDAFKWRLEQRDQEILVLQEQYTALLKGKETWARAVTPEGTLSLRSETTYLHIIGGLLNLLLGRSPSGQPYSGFRTQESVISAMIAHHGDRLGITERTLQAKFADAKRRLSPS